MVRYGQAILAVLTAIIAGVGATVTDGQFTGVEKVQVAIAATAAVIIFTTENNIWPLAKTVAAAFMGILNLAVGLVADGLSQADWLQLGVAVLTALGVFVQDTTKSRKTKLGT